MTTKLLRFSESPRLRTFDYKGHFAYHVTIVTAERQAVLLDDAHELIGTLRFAAEATAFDVLVYTIMPDHVHVLASGKSADANLVRFVQRFKQLTGYEFKRAMVDRCGSEATTITCCEDQRKSLKLRVTSWAIRRSGTRGAMGGLAALRRRVAGRHEVGQ